jgi:hypothetical protein
MPSLRDPATMHPLLVPLWQRFAREVRTAGGIVIFPFFWRSGLAQDRLHQIGRRGVPGEKIVTNARGGESWHNVERDGCPASLAFDFALMTADGQRYLPDDHPLWTVAGEIGERLGLTWGGRWKMHDASHLQLDNRGTLSLQQAVNGVDPDGGEG